MLRGFPGFYYEELLGILKSAWKLNRSGGAFGVLALGGAHDDGMAALVAKAAAGGKKVLVYSGAHNASRIARTRPLSYADPLGLRGGRSSSDGGLLSSLKACFLWHL